MPLVNWSAVWSMTGTAIGIVFVILILLVLILLVFNIVDKRKKVAEPKAQAAVEAPKAAKTAKASDEDADMEAAIATALYLFTAEVHDVESDVLTIVHNDRTKWGPIR